MGDTSLAGKFGLHPLDARTAVEVGQKLESRLEAFLELESPLAEVFEGYRRQNILENDDVNNELKPKLRSALPVRVADVDLYFALRDLHEAEESRWFDFTIEPASS